MQNRRTQAVVARSLARMRSGVLLSAWGAWAEVLVVHADVRGMARQATFRWRKQAASKVLMGWRGVVHWRRRKQIALARVERQRTTVVHAAWRVWSEKAYVHNVSCRLQADLRTV